MPRKPKTPTPESVQLHIGKTPEERKEAARQMALKRWSQTSTKQRRLVSEWLIAQREGKGGRPIDKTQPRCPCKRMTLKRARARGKVKTGHHQNCTFHQD